MTIQSQRSFRSGINYVLSLMLSYSTALIFCVTAFAEDACDKGKKTECFCECETIEADARGIGPCSITEKENSWCAIAYNGNTGSLGKYSMGPKDVSTDFNPNKIFGLSISEIKDLPILSDHRSESYAITVMELTSNIAWWDPLKLNQLAIDSYNKNTANQLILVWLRASYISAKSISSQEISDLDRIAAKMLADKYNVRSYFFRTGGRYNKFIIDDAEIFVRPGYIKIIYGNLKVRLILRSAMER